MTVQQPATETSYKNGLGISALILGIVAFAFAWIPFLNYFSIVLGFVGVALAILGLVRIRRRGANNPVVTVLGGLLSAGSIVIAFVVMAAFVSAVDEAVTEFDREVSKTERELDAYTECVDKLDVSDPAYLDKLAKCE